MQYLLGAVLVVAIASVYRVAFNSWCLAKVRGLQREHTAYLRDLENNRASWDFEKKAVEIRDFFRRAGIVEQTFSSMEDIGHGYARERAVGVFDNIGLKNRRVQGFVIASFHQAISVFEKRRRDALNPLLLIEELINLPAALITYLGIPKESAWPRLANVIAWVATVLGFLTSLPDFSGLQRTVSASLAAAWHLL